MGASHVLDSEVHLCSYVQHLHTITTSIYYIIAVVPSIVCYLPATSTVWNYAHCISNSSILTNIGNTSLSLSMRLEMSRSSLLGHVKILRSCLP